MIIGTPQSSSMRDNSKKVLITGGSSGLGLELTKLFLENNYDVTVIDLNTIRIKNPSLKFIKLDLSKRKSVLDFIQKDFDFDIVINNAATLENKLFRNQSVEELSDQIEVNIFAMSIFALYLSKISNEYSIRSLVNISSSAAHFPTPSLSVYGGSKSFVSRFSKNLIHENVYLHLVCLELSGMRTNFQAKHGIKDNGSMFLLDPKDVAEKIYKILLKKKSGSYTIGAVGKFLIFFKRLLPESCYERFLGWLFKHAR
jgi:short-subunit dehydrogenase